MLSSVLVFNECVFPTPAGLANFFFALVPPLITHLKIVNEECSTTQIKYILPKSVVLHAIRSRQFPPLEALSFDLTKQSVNVLVPMFVTLRALQLICMHGSGEEEEVAGSSLMDSLAASIGFSGCVCVPKNDNNTVLAANESDHRRAYENNCCAAMPNVEDHRMCAIHSHSCVF